MHICVIPWSRCVATGKHRYYTANDKLTQHWHIYQHSQNKLQPFLHSATKFGVALMNTFWEIFFKHSNPISSVVSEIKSGVRGSYAAEKVGTLKVNPLSPRPTASSRFLKSHAKGNSYILMGMQLQKRNKIQNKKICLPSYFLQLPDTFFFHLINIDTDRKGEKLAKKKKNQKSKIV